MWGRLRRAVAAFLKPKAVTRPSVSESLDPDGRIRIREPDLRTWRLEPGRYRVEWRSIQLGYVYFSRDGEWRWLSVRGVREGVVASLADGIAALVAAEEADYNGETDLVREPL